MSTRTALFNQAKESEQDSDKLLNLYWNRAELKKAYAEAQNEQHRLKEKIKEQEGDAIRLQQKLDHVEDMLLDPEKVHSVMVHYQLKALNNLCANKLAGFAEQLKRQSEERTHQHLLQTWNSKRSDRASKVEAKIGKLRHETQRCEEQILDLESGLESSNVFFRLFKRRGVKKQVEQLRNEIIDLNQRETTQLHDLDALQNSNPPGQPGLNYKSKRSINFMILSFAQQLYIQFEDDNLASLVKEAADKSVGSFNFGERTECDRLLDEIAKRWESFDNVTDYASILQQRSKLLADKAMFMNDDDVIPVAGTVSTLIDINDSGTASERNANLLGDNYWGLSKVLSR